MKTLSRRELQALQASPVDMFAAAGVTLWPQNEVKRHKKAQRKRYSISASELTLNLVLVLIVLALSIPVLLLLMLSGLERYLPTRILGHSPKWAPFGRLSNLALLGFDRGHKNFFVKKPLLLWMEALLRQDTIYTGDRGDTRAPLFVTEHAKKIRAVFPQARFTVAYLGTVDPVLKCYPFAGKNVFYVPLIWDVVDGVPVIVPPPST